MHKTARRIPGDSFGEITSHEILIPFTVTAGSRTMAIRKLLWALRQTNRCPYEANIDRLNGREIDEAEMLRIESLITCDSAAEISGHWDWPEEFVELGLDDKL